MARRRSTRRPWGTEIVAVSPEGVLQAGPVSGEAAVMVRYMNNIAVCAVSIPLPGEVSDEAYASLPRKNEIDELVWRKQKQLGMLPSPPASGSRPAHRRVRCARHRAGAPH